MLTPLLTIALALFALPTLASQRIALVIGNGAYQHDKVLPNPRNDADGMAAVLRRLGFEVTQGKDLAKSAMERTVLEFGRKASGADIAVVYFAGHGLEVGGRNYLLPVDAKLPDELALRTEAVDLELILEAVAPARTRLLFLDACRNNPLANNMRIRTAGRSVGRGLGRVEAVSNTLIAFATAPGTVAADGEGRNSPFASALIQHLDKPGLEIQQVMREVRRSVAQATRNQQVPWESSQLFDAVVLKPVTRHEPAQADPEQEAWELAKRRDTVAAYEGFLAAFPNGRMTGSARSALAGLRPETPGATLSTGTTVRVKIGHVGPLSGVIAHLGKDNELGAKMAISELNDAITMIGNNRAKFELVTEDDGADPKQGVSAAQRLVDAGVVGVIGHLNSGTTIPASAIYHQAGLVQISPSSTNPRYTRQGFSGVFRMVADDANLGRSLGRYAVKNMGASSVFVVDDRTAYGAGLADEFTQGVVQWGGRIVGREYTNDRATEFQSLVAAIKTKKPDLLFFGGMDVVAGSMLKELKRAGVKISLLGGDGICSSSLPELASGSMADNQVFCAEAGEDPGSAEMAEFRRRFKRNFGTEVLVYAPYTYDAVHVIVKAMQLARSINPAVYVSELKKIRYQGVTGLISFDEKGDVKNGAISLMTYRAGVRSHIATVR